MAVSLHPSANSARTTLTCSPLAPLFPVLAAGSSAPILDADSELQCAGALGLCILHHVACSEAIRGVERLPYKAGEISKMGSREPIRVSSGKQPDRPSNPSIRSQLYSGLCFMASFRSNHHTPCLSSCLPATTFSPTHHPAPRFFCRLTCASRPCIIYPATPSSFASASHNPRRFQHIA